MPRIENISESFLQAIDQVADYKPTINEEVHVPGYGVLSLHHAKKEAQLATEVAHEHAERGNHLHAAIQHERAAMFHKAIHAHLQKQQESVPHPGPSSQREDTLRMESVKQPTVESKEPDVNRVETKYRRQQALKNKQRDKDKQERRENKE